MGSDLTGYLGGSTFKGLIYGSSTYYLWVAQVNNLDDFRNLTPGQKIFFPPLEQGTVSS